MTTDTISELYKLQEGREVDIDALARRVAADEDLDATELDDVLREQNVEIADFSDMVSMHCNRNKLRQDIITGEECVQKVIGLHAAIETENAELEDAVAKHRAATQPMQHEIIDVQSCAPNANAARSELIRSCPSHITNKHTKASIAIEKAVQVLDNLKRELLEPRSLLRRAPNIEASFRGYGPEREQLTRVYSPDTFRKMRDV